MNLNPFLYCLNVSIHMHKHIYNNNMMMVIFFQALLSRGLVIYVTSFTCIYIFSHSFSCREDFGFFCTALSLSLIQHILFESNIQTHNSKSVTLERMCLKARNVYPRGNPCPIQFLSLWLCISNYIHFKSYAK